MPESCELKGQKGSILVGVLALSIAMTTIAGGYILVSGNTASRRLDAMDDLRLHYAAEGGAQLGLRWLKAYDSTYYGRKPTVWDEEVRITPDNFQIDNFGVQVKAVPTPPSSAVPFKIVSQATSMDKKNTLVISWSINSATDQHPADPAHNYISIPYTDNWVETYGP
jgi:hypothetical protein